MTSDLVLRWGYRKTTLEDIARGAEVAKGTLFLHWPNREALFVSLLRRERLRALSAVRGDLDPAGDDTRAADDAAPATAGGPTTARAPATGGAGTSVLYEFLRRILGEILARPLIRATIIGDEEMLGRLVRQPRPASTSAGAIREFRRYMETLRRLGVVRADLDLDELLASCTSTLTGFLLARQIPLPVTAALRDAVSDERHVELVADAMHRILRPADDGDATDGRTGGGRTAEGPTGGGRTGNEATSDEDIEAATAGATLELIDGALAAAREGYRVSLERAGRAEDGSDVHRTSTADQPNG